MHSFEFGGKAHVLPRGMTIGVIGDTGSGVADLLKAAGGRWIGPADELEIRREPLQCISYRFDSSDAPGRLVAIAALETVRRAGSTILLASHDTVLLRSLADEIWWVDNGVVRAQGDPGEVLAQYSGHVAHKVHTSGSAPSLQPAMRRGDGRAEIVGIDTLGSIWTSGEKAEIRVHVRFHSAVADPVVGIMIRSRIGMEVFGTNTELENLRFGPCAAGDRRTIRFAFDCNLCPQYYTVTAASHDPDGVWHDWMEDAVAVTVVDHRYTAGVVNLRARVSVTDSPE